MRMRNVIAGVLVWAAITHQARQRWGAEAMTLAIVAFLIHLFASWGT